MKAALVVACVMTACTTNESSIYTELDRKLRHELIRGLSLQGPDAAYNLAVFGYVLANDSEKAALAAYCISRDVDPSIVLRRDGLLRWLATHAHNDSVRANAVEWIARDFERNGPELRDLWVACVHKYAEPDDNCSGFLPLLRPDGLALLEPFMNDKRVVYYTAELACRSFSIEMIADPAPLQALVDHVERHNLMNGMFTKCFADQNAKAGRDVLRWTRRGPRITIPRVPGG